jgi:hypothetical protein
MSALTEHLELFKLDWLKDPAAALAQGRERGISDPHFVEMSAWCAELHAQLADLADERDIPLLLMGGNAAALRLEAAMQRGSRDNDYLTTASEVDIRGLMDALVDRFAQHFEEPLFRYRELHGGPDAEPLPLVAFAFHVPALLDSNAHESRLSIKLEFHIEDDPGLFPDSERVSGEFFALAQKLHAKLPKLPYQIALKLMTLVEPPVGIDAAREDSIPRQLYDIDVLLATLEDGGDWETLAAYSRRRYVKEEQQRHRTPSADGPWPSIGVRLDAWSQADDPQQPYGGLIRSFQGSQVTSATKRPPEQWRGRARRLQFAARCLATDAHAAVGNDAASRQGFARWQRARAIESRINEPAGPNLKAYRAALVEITGIAARKLGQFPRVPMWEHLAQADDIDAALDALDAAL